MKLRLFRRSSGGAERMVPEQSQSDTKIDPLESIIGYLAGDIDHHPFRDDLMKEINQLSKTEDLSAEAREALVDRIIVRRDDMFRKDNS